MVLDTVITIVNYNCHMFIVQATDLTKLSQIKKKNSNSFIILVNTTEIKTEILLFQVIFCDHSTISSMTFTNYW